MKKLFQLSIILVLFLALSACGANETADSTKTSEASGSDTQTSENATSNKPEKIVVGVVGANNEVWSDVAKRFEEGEGIPVEIVSFTEYSQPNEALAAGDLDLNSFQHQKFLDNYLQETGNDLTAIGNTVLAPIGLYSSKIESVDELVENDKVAIPDDVTNYARSLFLLQTAGLIEVNGTPGDPITVADITSNPLNLEIIPMDSSQTARSLEDVAISAINNGMATDAGYTPTQDSIFLEPVNEDSTPYINIIVARTEDKDNEWYNKLVKEYYQTPETATIIDETSKGSSIPAWDQE